MRREWILSVALAAFLVGAPAELLAQDGVVVVTGSRIERDDYDEYYDDEQSAIGLTRKADFFLKPIYINSDSRDPDTRKAEVDAMLAAAMERARAEGITVVAGNYTLKPLTPETMDDLSYGRGRRPDTTRISIYARLPVDGSYDRVDEVDDLVRSFVKDVPVTGRSYIETGSTNLGIDNPQQYRAAVVRAVAEESKRYAAMFGKDYGVEIRGLDSDLFFNQASETEVFLYIEHSFVIKPK